MQIQYLQILVKSYQSLICLIRDPYFVIMNRKLIISLWRRKYVIWNLIGSFMVYDVNSGNCQLKLEHFLAIILGPAKIQGLPV